MNTSTFGVGELIKDALDHGVEKILLGLGGSATNDGGTGMASALGFRFLDEKNDEIKPIGRNLLNIRSIQKPQKDEFSTCNIIVISDVSNPFYGPEGAAKTYGPQKGANQLEVELLDKGMEQLAQIIERDLGIVISEMPGSGAAGGLGGGCYAFLNAAILPGTEFIMQLFEFDELLKNADLLITGEGRMDAQSRFGKLPVEVAKRAFKAEVPVIAIAGTIDKEIRNLDIFRQMFALSDIAKTKEDAIKNAAFYVEQIANNLFSKLKDRKWIN
jgi:glycerate kinase